MNISDWIGHARDVYGTQLDTKIKVVGVIGKDYPDHGKGDNINCYLRENVFPVAASDEETCTIQAHYSEDEQILFLVMNGVDDVANIRKSILSDKKNHYFDAMAKSESQQLRMLHFLFIACHFVVVFEQTSRIDLEFMRVLKKVNSARLQLRKKVNRRLAAAGLREVAFNNRTLSNSESEGRMVIPRLLLTFQRNNIRSDVNAAKKRELYEKLEKNLDSQLNDILRSYELIESGGSSLCQLNETIPCVHLLNPKTVKRDIIGEMFESLMLEAENRTGNLPGLPSNNSFVMFLEDNFRSEKNEVSLQKVLDVLECLQCILDGSIDENGGEPSSFVGVLQKNHLQDAMHLYMTDGKTERRGVFRGEGEVEPVRIRSKEEHMIRFNEATRYIESVVGINTASVLTDLHSKCDEMWQSDMRACEAVSLMGRVCVRKVHPTFGDLTVSESRWQPHDAANTMVSTCVCGKKQLVRQEPFSVKEANYDFYEHAEFKCCRRLWRYQFQLYQDDSEEKEDIMWADRESNSLRAMKKQARRDDDLEEEELEDAMSLLEDEGSEEDARVRSQSSSSSTCSSDDMYVRPSSRREEQHSSKSERDLAVEHAKRIQRLEAAGRGQDFILHVPNSLTAGRLPLFPSWYLTSLGDSSIYNHGSGLKSQPNFKIGGDYLSPAVVYLDQVDLDVWYRDLNKVRSEDFSRKYVTGGKDKDDIARVKLFVGFEYECSRGHRFFVDHKGEPVIYSKGSNVVRESAQRSSLGDVLDADLPIRRPCTCRKLPLKSAQLQKVHVVTPKAPVHITINPQVLIPGHEGIYGTGQAPLELHHSKYYILHLPAVYSGPSGTWSPEEYSPDKLGTWIGRSIKVVYKPVLSFKW